MLCSARETVQRNTVIAFNKLCIHALYLNNLCKTPIVEKQIYAEIYKGI